MLRGLGADAIAARDLSSLDTLYFNAAALPWELKQWVMEAFPAVGVHELYGSTESGIITNLRPADMARKPGSVGQPWFMTEVRVVDADGNPVGPGGTGELFSRSPYLMRGYLKNPEATAACTTDDGFLSCGDIVHIDDEGYFYIVGRKSDMIVSGGINVYPREIEDVLATHPSVVEAAVVGLPSAQWGEEVTAYVVPRRRRRPRRRGARGALPPNSRRLQDPPAVAPHRRASAQRGRKGRQARHPGLSSPREPPRSENHAVGNLDRAGLRLRSAQLRDPAAHPAADLLARR